MLRTRIILGTLFGLALIALLYLDGHLSAHWPSAAWSIPPGLLVLLAIVCIIPPAVQEMYDLLLKEDVVISRRVCVVSAILCVAWPYFELLSDMKGARPAGASKVLLAVLDWFHTVKPHYLVPTVLAASLVGAFVMHSRSEKVHGAMASAGGSLLAIVYLGVLPSFYLPIRLSHSADMIITILLVVKSADIGAFFVGRLMGRHKLIVWLSPGKTVEGFLGGIAMSTLVCMLLAHLVHGFSWEQGAVAGALLGAVGQFGDLVESLLKRDAGVKDSGRVPGFGGLLDMLDSPLLAAPVAYWILKLAGKA